MLPKRVAVVGDDRWNNELLIKVKLQELISIHGTNIIIMSGGNLNNADSMINKISSELGLRTYNPAVDESQYNEVSVTVSNLQLIDNKPDLVIVFSNDYNKDEDVNHLLYLASDYKVPFKIYSDSELVQEVNFDESLLITHTDLDGLGCEILIKKISPTTDVWRVNYDFEDNKVLMNSLKNYKRIIFTDISFSTDLYEVLDKFRSKGVQVLLLDHHLSSKDRFEDKLNDNNWMIIDLERSGTKLVYDYFKPTGLLDEYKDFVDAVNDFDLWIHENEDSIPLQFIFDRYPSQDKFVDRWLSNSELKFSDYELDLLKLATDKFVQLYTISKKSMKFGVDSNGYRFGLCTFSSNFSLIAMELNKEFSDDIDYLAGYQYYFKSSLSFRSTNEEVRVDKIAENLGGGGHILASGASIPEGLSDVDFYETLVNGEWVTN